MQKYFEVGQIVNTFGINGTVKVKPFTDEIERFEELKNVLIDKNNKLIKCEIENVKYQKQMVLLKFKGLDNINQVEQYKGCYLKIERKYAKKLPEDTYFIADLLGLSVYTDEDILLGKVEDIYNSGANDIYVIKSEDGKQILLPGTKEVIKQIDLEQERITVHIIKGLI